MTFLIWLIIRRLAIGHPMALQVHQNYPLFFHEGGVCQFTDLEDRDDEINGPLISHSPGGIQALADSNPDVVKPMGAVRAGRPFFVVEMVSPRPQRVEWFEEVNYLREGVRWTFSEILQVYVGLPTGVHNTHASYHRSFWGLRKQLWDLLEEFEAPLGVVAFYASGPTGRKREVAGLVRSISAKSPDTLSGLYIATTSLIPLWSQNLLRPHAPIG